MTIALTISEADFMARVIDYAILRGWKVAHFRPARTATGWRTAMTGDVGFPDLVLARDGRVVIAELKRQQGRPTPGQLDWLKHLGGLGRLWQPTSWNDIVKELR